MKAASLTLLLSVFGFSRVCAALAPADLDLATAEVSRCYAKAHPEVQEFVLHTARTF